MTSLRPRRLAIAARGALNADVRPHEMSAAAFRKSITSAMEGYLRNAGFRKRADVFVRPVADVFHLVALQASQSSTRNNLKVTVNLAVQVPALAESPANLSISTAHWSQRLGHCLPKPSDVWWTASTPEQATFVAAQIVEALQQYGVPALESLSDSSALLKLWESGKSPGLTRHQAARYAAALHDRAV